MATGLYADLEPVRRALNIRDGADNIDDDLIQAAVLAASAAVDGLCNRPHGFLPDAAASTRIYNSVGCDVIIDDVASLIDFGVDAYESAGVWSAIADFDTELQLEPLNALADGRPFSRLTGSWPSYRIRVTARWGWPEVPAPVAQATQLLAQRLFARKDSPSGTAGWDAAGMSIRVTRVDPDVQMLLAPYVRPTLP